MSKINYELWILLIMALTYLGITYADIVNLLDKIITEFGKAILIIISIAIVYNLNKK